MGNPVNKQVDIAHVMFLEMIGTFIRQLGAQSAKGILMRDSMALAESFPVTEFASMEDFVKAIEDFRSPISQIEGQAVHMGDGLFGLPKCPFANSISAFKGIHGGLPGSFSTVAEDYNRPHPITEKLDVGQGAGVSPFCAIHQPLRSTLAKRVKIGGKQVAVLQLGCKGGDGKKAIADKIVAKTAVDRARVEKVLDQNMCCYQVVIENA